MMDNANPRCADCDRPMVTNDAESWVCLDCCAYRPKPRSA